MIQKSTASGSHGISAVKVMEGVMDGIGVGGSHVLVGMTLVFTTTWVLVSSVAAQDTRINARRRIRICFIKCMT